MKFSLILQNKWIDFLVILIFAMLGMKALLHPDLFTAHDIWHQVARIYYYYQAINDGQLPPYWISNLSLGLGYPLFFFSYHFPWIISLPFLKIGFDIPVTLKILFFISFLFSGFSMYFFAKTILKKRLAAILSSIIYMWAPYHFLAILVSASMGIAFVFIFLPLVLLGIHLTSENKKIGISLIGVSIAGIILSHLIHLIFLMPLIISFTIWEFIRVQKILKIILFIKKLFLGLILGLLLSSFYLLPAMYYKNDTRIQLETGFSKLYQRNFINLTQIIYSKWGYSPIVNNAKDGEISFQLGIAQWISIIGLTLLLIFKMLSKETKILSITLVISLIINIFLMMDYSKVIWIFLEGFLTIDYPFRILMSCLFIGSISAGILIASLAKFKKLLVFLLILFVALFANRNHVNVNQYTQIPLSTYLASETTTNSYHEYLPIKTDPNLLNNPGDLVYKDIIVSKFTQSSNVTSFNIYSSKDTNTSMKQFYFPGQTLYIDNKKEEYKIDNQGRINTNISSGQHKIVIKFEETKIIKFSKVLSILGLIIIIIIFL